MQISSICVASALWWGKKGPASPVTSFPATLAAIRRGKFFAPHTERFGCAKIIFLEKIVFIVVRTWAKSTTMTTCPHLSCCLFLSVSTQLLFCANPITPLDWLQWPLGAATGEVCCKEGQWRQQLTKRHVYGHLPAWQPKTPVAHRLLAPMWRPASGGPLIVT